MSSVQRKRMASTKRGDQAISVLRQIGIALRYALPCVILSWLSYRLWAQDRHSLEILWRNAEHWPQFVLAVAIYLLAVMGTFLRWRILVLALHLPFSVGNALRLGFVGYVLQFVSLGSLGGDVFKAILIAREQPDRKPEAAATVLVDRFIGLFSLTIVVLIGVGLWNRAALGPYAAAKPVCIAMAIVGSLIFATVMFTRISLIPITRLRPFYPLRSSVFRIQSALDLYRKHVVAACCAGGWTGNPFHAGVGHLSGRNGLFPNGPELRAQIFMWGVAGIVGAIPIVPGGLGTFDIAYKTLYESVSIHHCVPNEGFLVAILFRVMCLTAAAVGVVIFWTSKQSLEVGDKQAR